MKGAPVAQTESFNMRAKVEPAGTIAFPVRDTMNTSTVLSLMTMERGDMAVDILVLKGSVLPLQRNALIQQMRGDWILFIDDDMVWEPDAVLRLLQTKEELDAQGVVADVLGGLCFRRGAPHQPTLYVRTENEGPFNFLEDWDTDIVDVDGTGMAFALVTKQCLERIAGGPMLPHEERIKLSRPPQFFTWYGAMGEDLRFCETVKKAGGRILVDTRIHIGHVGEKTFGYDDYLKEVITRPPEVTAERRKINDHMGMPTLTRSQAKRKLQARA